jgi:medium-chain acyl-[acyl-carrier-protein] hydrolase
LVPLLAEALLPVLDRPFAFYGHSLGAIVSFELSRWLRNRYTLPQMHLFVSGRRAPNVVQDDSPTADQPDEKLIAYLQDLNGTPPDVLNHGELLKLALPAIRADFRMAEHYVYRDGAPLSFPITAFGGLDDAESAEDRLDQWRNLTTGRFTKHMLEGDHFFIHAHQRELLAVIGEALGQRPHVIGVADRRR